MNVEGAKKFIIEKLQNELANNLFYHGLHHTIDVCRAAHRFAALEKISGEEYHLLMTAAHYHDAGFLHVYSAHEQEGVQIVQQVLPNYGYSSAQIDTIAGMILATKLPQSPKTHLEQIMCDADLDYLGRKDFLFVH